MMPPPSENPLKTSAQFGEDVDSRTKAKIDQESQDGTSSSSTSEAGIGSAADKVVVVDMTLEEDLGAEKVCRICHLSNEQSSGSPELIQLGCNCREDLAISHRHCAEAWFKQKGNRLVLLLIFFVLVLYILL